MSLVELRRFRSRMDGEIARTFLESHGLHTVLFDADSQGYFDGLSADVRLMVWMKIARMRERPSTAFNPSADAPLVPD